MLSHFSHVQLFVTPWTAAYQAPLSIGFSRQEYWSGVPLPSLLLVLLNLIKLLSLFFTPSVTFFIVFINLCLYIGLLQFCGFFIFFSYFLSFLKFLKIYYYFSTFIPLIAFPTVLFPLELNFIVYNSSLPTPI